MVLLGWIVSEMIPASALFASIGVSLLFWLWGVGLRQVVLVACGYLGWSFVWLWHPDDFPSQQRAVFDRVGLVII
jgi:hypothetical protein